MDAKPNGEAAPGFELVPFEPKPADVNALIDALAGRAQIRGGLVPPCWLDRADEQLPAAEILAVENGLLHTPTRTLLAHTPTFFNVNALPFAYDPTAACPGWLSFLDSLWPDDPSSIATLQEWFGYPRPWR